MEGTMKTAIKDLNFQYLIGVILVFFIALSLPACVGEQRTFDISIRMPAGEGIVNGTSAEEVQAKSGTISITAAVGAPDANIYLISEGATEGSAKTYICSGMTVKLDVTRGTWYKIRIEAYGNGTVGYDYGLTVKNVTLRIQ